MTGIGRTCLGFGVLLVVAGAVLLLAARFGVPLGRLPGDLHWRGRHMEFFAPLGTCLLLSLLLTLVLAVFRHFRT